MKNADISRQLQAIVYALNHLVPDGTVKYEETGGVTTYDFSRVDTKIVNPVTGCPYTSEEVREKVYSGEWSINYGRKVMGLPDYVEIQKEEVINGEAPSSEILNKRAEILRTAEELINGDRAQTYGPPEISFGRIADIWNAMGIRRHVVLPPTNPETEPHFPGKATVFKAEKLDAIDAAHMLIGMKLSRTVGSHGAAADDWIDLAGYAGLGGEMAAPVEDSQ